MRVHSICVMGCENVYMDPKAVLKACVSREVIRQGCLIHAVGRVRSQEDKNENKRDPAATRRVRSVRDGLL